ncbi:MAG: hypothetical protein J2P44_06350 [Candidatus Dormibacteraeota bacterium]|nr:hypothetical protein [Candidatus Dormibacteraeota bacterium]
MDLVVQYDGGRQTFPTDVRQRGLIQAAGGGRCRMPFPSTDHAWGTGGQVWTAVARP